MDIARIKLHDHAQAVSKNVPGVCFSSKKVIYSSPRHVYSGISKETESVLKTNALQNKGTQIFNPTMILVKP
jgi:hypothetical protein